LNISNNPQMKKISYY